MEHDYDPFNSHMGEFVAETAIAVVGMSCRFSQARGIDEFWDLLRSGREAIQTYSEEELLEAGVGSSLLRNRNYVPCGAPLDDMECFDATLFGLSPRDAAIMDPQHRHFLECTWEALENAGHTPERFDGVIGVYAGSGHNAYMPYNLLTNPKLVRDVGLFLLRHTSNDKDFLTTRVSYMFDLKGPSINVQTACSTSLVAIHMAAQSLLNGECDMAIAGGSSVELPHRQGYLYEEGEILSPDGHCRPFDASSQGTVFGSGVAVVVLRRLSDAIEAGDHIYAVLRGSAINNDGAGKVGYLAPSVDGQAKVIAEALAIAEVDAGTVGYVEAHGTGTPVGDPIELAALTQAFRQTTDSVGHCAIGSVKASIGHTDTAAGAAGLIKVSLALHNRELPASLNFEVPNPALALEGSPFRVQDKLASWTSPHGAPRRAGVSSLGVGGTNAHVILEEAPQRRDSGSSHRRSQLLLCSANSAVAADANAAALKDFLKGHPGANIADTSFTLATGRRHLPHRRFVVACSAQEAADNLNMSQDGSSSVHLSDRQVAFLFCGAGPQHVDMARELYEIEPVFAREVDRGLNILERLGVLDGRRWLFPSEADRAHASIELGRPSIALPLLFIVQTACARLWMSIGVQPSAMIGHSSGEYAAAHLSGVIDLESSLRIVSERGRLFETISGGGMLSVPLGEEQLRPLLPKDLSIAAINAPKLCVVSGPEESIVGFRAILADQEIEAQLVPISVAAHSPLLEPILPEFKTLLQSIKFGRPQLPFVSNLTGDWATEEDVCNPDYWVRHLRQTVRFTDGLKRLLDEPDRALLEVGPGRSMASLVRQHPDCGRNRPIISSMRHPEQHINDDAAWLDALGQLWSVGVPIDWDAYWAGEQRLRIPLPTYQFERQRHWFEPGAELSLMPEYNNGSEHCDDITQWQHEPVWSRSYKEATAEPANGPALIFEDSLGFGREIASKLELTGHDVIILRAGNRFARLGESLFTISPASQPDYSRLFEILSAEGRLPAQIYHCWLVTGDGRRQADTARLIELGFHSIVTMARELAYHADDALTEIALVTDRLQRVAGDRDLMPVKATALGAASVVSTEYPNLRVRSIDIVVPHGVPTPELSGLAEATIDELSSEYDPRALAYRDGERWSQEFAQVPVAFGADKPRVSIRSNATYLITGGLGGLGMAIAAHLAEQEGVRIVMLGRSSLPPRESWVELLASGSADPVTVDRVRKVLSIEAAGAVVEFISADVGNSREFRAAIRKVLARTGPIHGVFHAAGVLDDGLIETKSRGSMDAVLRPKVAGTLALEHALEGHQPEFIMLFSSISAFAGLPGQADYAAANAFLDAYAQSRIGMAFPNVISVGWSPWREVGMAARLEAHSDKFVQNLPEGELVDHPFLESLHVISPDELVVASTLSPEKHWLLDEHRLEGQGALIPGTGFLELARSAHAMLHPGAAILSDVTFLAPFVVPDGTTRDLRVHLKRRVGENWRFAILGRASGAPMTDWVEHATGQISATTAPETPETIEIEAIEANCPNLREEAEAPGQNLNFGPRWTNVQRIAYGQNEAILHLAMDQRFDHDFDRLLLHPALLDFATAGAQSLIPGYEPGKDLFVPFSYGRLALHSSLPRSIVSHIRYRPAAIPDPLMAVFDVTIIDNAGQVLAEISEFTMMRVREAVLFSRGPVQPSGESALQSTPLIGQVAAIFPEQGLAVVESLLAGPARAHVVISPSDVNNVLARLRASRCTTVQDGEVSRPDGEIELPSTAMEKGIAELWSDLLGIHPVGRNDNFFDLGGHSLLAVQFANRLRKKTGKTLPLAALLENPTVASLALELDPASAAPEGRVSNDNVSEPTGLSRRDIVTIRAGGSLPPIFFVHDGLGETLLYRGLAMRLDSNRPVYGIEPLLTASGDFAHTRIDEMAANYIERIKVLQPHGPYLLAGLCAGGVIAFEIAQQLQNAGDLVGYVGVIDAADVAASKRSFYIGRARLRRVQSLLHEESAITLIPQLVRKAANTVKWEVHSRLEAARNRQALKRMQVANTSPDETSHSSRTSLPFLKLYEVAHTQHRPKGLLSGGNVFLFKASNGNGDVDDIPYTEIYGDIALGWGKRVADQVTLINVPGGHSTALQDPHVRTLAPLFQEAIDSAMERLEQSHIPFASDPEYYDSEAVAAE